MSKHKFHRLIYMAVLSPLLVAGCTAALSSPRQTDEPDSTRPLKTEEPTPTRTPDVTETIASPPTDPTESNRTPQPTQTKSVPPTNTVLPPEDDDKAHVLSVQASGSAGSYIIAVEIRSPDLGCEQYADWWEVIDNDGNLLYRRILVHSHVGEQPFTRSGGPVPIEPNSMVIVRAHMNNSGYGGIAFKGSVQEGFLPTELDADFAADLDEMPPLPKGCAF